MSGDGRQRIRKTENALEYCRKRGLISLKIIIAGNGKVGAALTRQLSAEGDDLTLIDSNLKVLQSSEEPYDII